MAIIGYITVTDPAAIRRHVSPAFMALVRRAHEAGLRPSLQSYISSDCGQVEMATCRLTGRQIGYDHGSRVSWGL